MKKLIVFIFILLFSVAAYASDEPTVYVSGFGNDANPGTKDLPLKTIEAGFYALPHGGKLVLTSAYTLGETVNELPVAGGLITVTSFDGTTDYRNEFGSKLYLIGSLSLRSDLKFEYVDFIACEKNLVIHCNGHYACFGEGINCSTTSKDINNIGITGGGSRRHPANGSAIEIHSGDWNRIRGGQRNSDRASFDGDVAIAIYGGTFHSSVELGGDIPTNGNAKLFIFGGEFKSSINLTNADDLSGDVNLSIYGGSFAKPISLSNGGTVNGNVTVTALAKTNAEIVCKKGSVSGEIRIETTHPINIKSSFATYVITAENADVKKTQDAEFIKNTFTCNYFKNVPNSSYIGKLLANRTLLCDVDANGYISLFDALALALDKTCDIKCVLNAVSKKNDESYSLYGATFDGDVLCDGYAFTTSSFDGYKVSSSVTLGENGIVTLFFGCDKNSPDAKNGYCIEADVSKNTLCAYKIIDGNYRILGRKNLALLSDKAEIYVEYSNLVANLYFDDNPLEKEQFFDFNFELDKYGNEVGIYVKNGKATLPKCEAFANCEGSDTYTNELLYSFTDPDIFCENGVYYIYGSGNGNGQGIASGGINCFSTTDFENFKYEGQVLKKGDVYGDNSFLAANIVKYGDYYYMFYLSDDANEKSSTSCASSKSPTGPFTNDMKPLTTIPDMIGGQPFVDDDGTVYLIYTRTTGGNQTYGAKVILKDGKAELDLSTEKFLLGVTEPWEAARASVVECGLIVKHDGLYYLIYAGGNYNSSYGVGYATSKNPLGPYTKYENNPIFIGTTQSYGVGAASVFPSADGIEYFIIHLRHFSYSSVRPLQTAMDRFRFVKDPRGGADIIEICGPTVTPQKIPSAKKVLSADEWQNVRFHP